MLFWFPKYGSREIYKYAQILDKYRPAMYHFAEGEDTAILSSIPAAVWDGLDELAEPDGGLVPGPEPAYQPPLDGQLEYRGWYRITSGIDKGRSLWSPNFSRYGATRPDGRLHNGCDLYSYGNETLKAVYRGRIQYNVVNDGNWGNIIYLYHIRYSERMIAVYAHLDAKSAFEGVRDVQPGTAIGFAGCSGNAGPNTCNRSYMCNGRISVEDHLHLEIMKVDSNGSVLGRRDPVSWCGLSVRYAGDQSGVCLRSVQQIDP